MNGASHSHLRFDMKRTVINHCALVLLLGGMMAAASAPAQPRGGDVYQAIIQRDFGTASNELIAVEKEIADTRPEQYAPIEARLIAVLEAPGATLPGKQFACQMLRTVGSAQCVPAVSRLLTDEKLSHVARQVFQDLRDPAVDEALRQALARTQGDLRLGIVHTLGDRRNRSSLEAISALAAGADEATARAALNALGKIGGAPAADALERLQTPGSLRGAWADASLRCAAGLAATGDAGRAQRIAQSLFEGDYPLAVRAGAFGALVQAQREQAAPLILKTLSAGEALLKRAALGAVLTVPGHAATQAFAQGLATLPPEGKVVLLGGLASRGDGEGLTLRVNQLATDENPAVREAAIRSLGRLGDVSSVPALAAALKEKDFAAGVTQTLIELQGAGVTAALIQQAQAEDATVRQGVLAVLAERRQTEALPAVRLALNDADAMTRRVALKTLATLGTQEDLTTLAGKILASKDEADRGQMAQAMSDIGARINDKAARSAPVLQAFAKADAPAKMALLAVLSSLGGEPALQAVRAALAGDAGLRKTALRALADWPDAAPMADLLTMAKGDPDKASQVLALRGYIRMVGQSGGRADQKIQCYREALGLCAQPEQKRLVLAGLAEVAHADALKMVEPFLDDAALQREAFVSYEKIAEALAGRQPAMAKAALQRVVAQTTDNGLRNKARKALDKIK